MFRADEMEQAVLGYLHRLVDTPQFATLARGELEQLLSDDGASLEARLGAIEQRQRELDRQMDWLIEEAALPLALVWAFAAWGALPRGSVGLPAPRFFLCSPAPAVTWASAI